MIPDHREVVRVIASLLLLILLLLLLLLLRIFLLLRLKLLRKSVRHGVVRMGPVSGLLFCRRRKTLCGYALENFNY